jgi:16S rRNA (uracil1498-N3)-methyltransferase
VKPLRIYHANLFGQVPEIGTPFLLTPEASLHVAVVLRRKIGDPLTLFAGDNREFDAVIHRIEKKSVEVIIEAIRPVNRESPCEIHLAQAISKGDRMDFVLQKATELGVHRIYPLFTARSVVKLDESRAVKKQAQWAAIAVSACEQSGRNQLPGVEPLNSLNHFLQECNTSYKLILDPLAKTHWRDAVFDDGAITVLIGPEGGLTSEEISLAQQKGFTAVSLGPRILRTETAAIVILSLLQAVSGDFS